MNEDQKVLLITGASSGIGAATARAAAECGYRSVVRRPDNLGFSWFVSVQGKARLAVNGCLPLLEPERCHGR